MSLFKQLSIMLTLFLGIILASVMILNFKTATEFVQNQLYTDAKNTSHSLGLSLSKVADPEDTSTMDTMINAIFDSGYYEFIFQRADRKTSHFCLHKNQIKRRNKGKPEQI